MSLDRVLFGTDTLRPETGQLIKVARSNVDTTCERCKKHAPARQR